MRKALTFLSLSALLLAGGCGDSEPTVVVDGDRAGANGPAPVFSLAWSEYPSWSTFGVASDRGLIDGAEGEMGPIEKKYNVDIVLKQADYEPCLTMYATGDADAVCMTNMDALNPALNRKSTAILPTSTSDGADAVIVTPAVASVDDLKGKPVYGLSQSVSEYMFVRNLEMQGKDPRQFTFTMKDPAIAAQAMQLKQDGYDAIAVWNPFVLQTLQSRPDTKVLFDSTSIPGEIIDMVVVGQDSLKKPGGDRFAQAVAATYYGVCGLMADPSKRQDTLVALGEKFSNLDAKAMETVVTQTKFYDTPQKGIDVLTNDKLKETMKKVVAVSEQIGLVKTAPTLGYGKGASADLVFDPQYLEAVAGAK